MEAGRDRWMMAGRLRVALSFGLNWTDAESFVVEGGKTSFCPLARGTVVLSRTVPQTQNTW